MRGKTINIEGLEDFTLRISNDISFDLYKNFADSEESLREYGEAFSDFYYISCAPFKNDMENWKDIPEVYDILKRCMHMAEGQKLEVLIGKYSEDTMEKARKITEKRRKEFEGTAVTVEDPKSYMYIVGFFGGTTGRTNKEIIGKIGENFKDKVKVLKN